MGSQQSQPENHLIRHHEMRYFNWCYPELNPSDSTAMLLEVVYRYWRSRQFHLARSFQWALRGEIPSTTLSPQSGLTVSLRWSWELVATYSLVWACFCHAWKHVSARIFICNISQITPDSFQTISSLYHLHRTLWLRWSALTSPLWFL